MPYQNPFYQQPDLELSPNMGLPRRAPLQAFAAQRASLSPTEGPGRGFDWEAALTALAGGLAAPAAPGAVGGLASGFAGGMGAYLGLRRQRHEDERQAVQERAREQREAGEMSRWAAEFNQRADEIGIAEKREGRLASTEKTAASPYGKMPWWMSPDVDPELRKLGIAGLKKDRATKGAAEWEPDSEFEYTIQSYLTEFKLAPTPENIGRAAKAIRTGLYAAKAELPLLGQGEFGSMLWKKPDGSVSEEWSDGAVPYFFERPRFPGKDRVTPPAQFNPSPTPSHGTEMPSYMRYVR